MTWFTEKQLKQTAHDFFECALTVAEAQGDDMKKWPEWATASADIVAKYTDEARVHLEGLVPLDLSRPICMRDKSPVELPTYAKEGVGIHAFVPRWEHASCTWFINGRSDLEEECPEDLVYSDA